MARQRRLARLVALAAVIALLLAALGPIARPAGAFEATLTRDGDTLTLANGVLAIRYDTGSGTADLTWGGRATVRHAYGAARLRTPDGPRQVRSVDAAARRYEQERVDGPEGHGILLRVINDVPDPAAVLTQTFTVFDSHPYALLRVSAGRDPNAAGASVAADQIEVLAAGGVTDPPGQVNLLHAADPRLYRMPFDNTEDISVDPAAEQHGTVSYWLTALIDAASGAGLVAGATESRIWKSAAWYDGPSGSLSLFSGARAPADSENHAARSGGEVASAEFLIGGYGDHRDGLADLMRMVALREPPLPAPDLPPPMGWNPWYQYEFGADEGTVHAIADTLAGRWAALGYRYVNLDAGWNVSDGDWTANPSRFPSGMAALASYIHERGLLAGSYFIPFAVNPVLLDQPIPGTPYHFRDAILRDDAGRPVPAGQISWEYVLDGTHPGALTYLRDTAAAIAADGFDFVKLDFLPMGTIEGRHADPSATGMAAFHRGMDAVREGLASAGHPVYVSAAIAPLYVQEFANARRTGNDVGLGQERAAGNIALSWFTGLLYDRNDPDNVVVRPDWFPGYDDGLARMHATMDALGGALFIMGDDPRGLSPERAELLTDPAVLDLVHESVTARPLDVGETPARVWVGRPRDGGVVVGIFNWDDAPAHEEIAFAQVGLDPARPYRVRDIWNPEAGSSSTGRYAIDLPPRSAALLRIDP